MAVYMLFFKCFFLNWYNLNFFSIASDLSTSQHLETSWKQRHCCLWSFFFFKTLTKLILNSNVILVTEITEIDGSGSKCDQGHWAFRVRNPKMNARNRYISEDVPLNVHGSMPLNRIFNNLINMFAECFYFCVGF